MFLSTLTKILDWLGQQDPNPYTDAPEELIATMTDADEAFENLQVDQSSTANDIKEKTTLVTERVLKKEQDHPEHEKTLSELQDHIQKLEASHPKLTEGLNRLLSMLSDLGI